jgi:2-hydroxy-6-oxonona-2,4-dienedioate hydrolase
MLNEPITTHFTTLNGRRVRWRMVGAAAPSGRTATFGLPLLLVHGLCCSADVWEPSLRRLARMRLDQPVFAPDLPGCGHSPGPGEALGMEELADWSVRLMDALGIARAHVVGNSMGCQVALALAHRQPERVGGLVLAGPTIGAEVVPAWRYMLGLMLDGLREPVRYNALLTKLYYRMGPLGYIATVRKMLDHDPLSCARMVTAPCLVVRGESDAVVPDLAARRLAAVLPRGVYTVVEGAAHALQFGWPEAFTRLLVEFLGPRVEGEAPAGRAPDRPEPTREPSGAAHAGPPARRCVRVTPSGGTP